MLIDNIDISAEISGDGPPLLFLHGWGVGHDSYTPLLAHLRKRFTVHSPDLPGFGKSPEPPEPWDAGRYAEFTARYCEQNGLTVPVVMGHSNGGRVLIKLLSRRDCPVAPPKAVLFDSAGIKPRRAPSYYLKVYSYKAGKLLLTPFPKLKAKFQAGRGSSDYRSASPLMRATMSKLLAEDLSGALHLVKPPTLLIWGEGDTATPIADGRLMEKRIPGAGLVTLPGGHWAFMERLPQTLRILDSFLGGV